MNETINLIVELTLSDQGDPEVICEWIFELLTHLDVPQVESVNGWDYAHP